MLSVISPFTRSNNNSQNTNPSVKPSALTQFAQENLKVGQQTKRNLQAAKVKTAVKEEDEKQGKENQPPQTGNKVEAAAVATGLIQAQQPVKPKSAPTVEPVKSAVPNAAPSRDELGEQGIAIYNEYLEAMKKHTEAFHLNTMLRFARAEIKKATIGKIIYASALREGFAAAFKTDSIPYKEMDKVLNDLQQAAQK
jgi:hypothetical protein